MVEDPGKNFSCHNDDDDNDDDDDNYDDDDDDDDDHGGDPGRSQRCRLLSRKLTLALTSVSLGALTQGHMLV